MRDHMTRDNKLWAPWRIDYIQRSKEKGCFLCRIIKEKKDLKNFVLMRTQKTISLLNIYPYNNGHIMVVPKKHVKSLEQLQPRQIEEVFLHVKKTVASLKKAFKPSGFNIGINLGKTAGAGLEGHLHVHIVPRWDGDTNFMPVISNTKVLCQSLQHTYQALKKYL